MSAEKTVMYLSDHLSSGAITSSGRRGVLFSPLVCCGAGDENARAPLPRQQLEPAGRHVLAIMVEIDNDLEQVRDLYGSALRVGGQVIAVSVEQGLIDAHQIAGAVLVGHELQEPARAVEELADAGRRQAACDGREHRS